MGRTATSPAGTPGDRALAVAARDALGLSLLLLRASTHVLQCTRRRLRRLELTLVEFCILAIVKRVPGLTQSRVAEVLGIERSRMVRILDGLEERALIERATARKDRRSHALFVSTPGSQLVSRAMRQVREHEQDIVNRLGSTDHGHLLRALHVLSTEQGDVVPRSLQDSSSTHDDVRRKP